MRAGDYLDHRDGFPGVDLEGGGAFTHLPDGRLQRWYLRGTAEYYAAHRGGLLVPLPRLSPASDEALTEFEADLGRPLPPLLRRCYLELGDGGFGPGYALSSLAAMREQYQRRQRPEPSPAPAHALVPICEWGCGIASFVDISDAAYRMWAMDPTEPEQEILFAEPFDFTEWMYRWTVDAWLLPCQPYAETSQCHDSMDDVLNALGPGDPWGDTDPWADAGERNSGRQP